MADNEPQPSTSGLPTDAFSILFRQLSDNPGAVQTSSRVDIADFYARRETWAIDTFRIEGAETVFVQKMSPEGGLRLILPPLITMTINHQHDRATRLASPTAPHRPAVATRFAWGDTLGNGAGL